MRKIFSFIIYACFSVNAFAFGSQLQWESGWGQGTAEYVVLGKGESQLYIGCNPDKVVFVMYTDPTGKSISNYDGMSQIRVFNVSIDGEEAIPFNDVDSDAGASNFSYAWERLRKGRTVKVTGDNLQSATFTLKGAAKLLPELVGSSCHFGWNIPAE